MSTQFIIIVVFAALAVAVASYLFGYSQSTSVCKANFKGRLTDIFTEHQADMRKLSDTIYRAEGRNPALDKIILAIWGSHTIDRNKDDVIKWIEWARAEIARSEKESKCATDNGAFYYELAERYNKEREALTTQLKNNDIETLDRLHGSYHALAYHSKVRNAHHYAPLASAAKKILAHLKATDF